MTGIAKARALFVFTYYQVKTKVTQLAVSDMSSPDKRRKVLGEISNVESHPKLEFDAVRITKPSQIPVPKRRMTTKADLQRSLAHVKSRLEQKIRIPDSREKELSELRAKHHELENDTDDLRRDHKRLLHKLVEVQAEIDRLQQKFEWRGDMVMKNVASRERMVDIKLREISNKYNDEYNEARFQLEDELKLVREYNDEELVREIHELEQQEKELHGQLEEAKAAKHDVLRKEADALKAEVAQYLETKTLEVDQLSKQHTQRSEALLHAKAQLEAMERKIEDCQTEINRLEASHEQAHHTTTNYQARHAELRAALQEAEAEVGLVKHTFDSWDAKYNAMKHTHSEVSQKTAASTRQRRILENQIMELERRVRVYVAIPLPAQENTLVAHGTSYSFSKVTTPSELIDEFLCLLKTVMSGSNVTIVFTGESSPVLQTLERAHAMYTSTDIPNWQFTVTRNPNNIEVTGQSLSGKHFESALSLIDVTHLDHQQQAQVLREDGSTFSQQIQRALASSKVLVAATFTKPSAPLLEALTLVNSITV